MSTRIGNEHVDSLLTYPQANNLSMNAQPIRERGHHPNRITRGAHAHRLPTPPGTQPTQSPPHRARSRHSRRPASIRAIDRNDHMDNNRLPRLPAPSADTRMSVRAANLATRSSGSLKPNLSASAGRAHERPRAGPRPRTRRKPSADAPRRTVDRASVSGLRLAPFIRPTSRALSTGIHAESPVSTAPPFCVVAALSAEQHCRL